MKRKFYVLFGVFVGLFFFMPSSSLADGDYSQETASGYFQIQSDGSTYFITMDNTVGTRLSNYNTRFETEFNNFSFPVASGTDISNITLSLRKNGFTNISPNRLAYNCQMAESSSFAYSRNNITQREWEDVYSKDQFVDFTFLFDPTTCDLSKIISFSLFFERSNPDVAGASQGSNDAIGLGANVAGNREFFDNYEWKIKINSNLLRKNPVLIIPGVLGTDIIKDDQKIWLNLSRNASDFGDQFMDLLGLDKEFKPIDTNLRVGDLVMKPIEGQHFYDEILKEFETQSYKRSENLYTFPYDWRYGVSKENSEGKTNVQLLKEKIDEIVAQTGSSKVDVVAHSTGGLLAKKYVMENMNDNHIGKAVFVGVPNTGSPKAVKVLLVGDNFGVPWLAEEEMQKISQNLPVVYDLLPSQKYYNNKGSFIRVIDQKVFTSSFKDLNFSESNSFLINDHSLNSTAVSLANNLHSFEFDNFDLRTAGVDLYSISGCKTSTLSKIFERRVDNLVGPDQVMYDSPENSPGDGTVTLESATNLPINEVNKYYALKSDHGKMLSQDGIRQQIVNIISGSNLETNKITQDVSKCKLKGKAFSVYSPIDIEVTDSEGNRAALESGAINNSIPGADFQIWGEHKFVFVPTDEGQSYTINLKGTGAGTFTFKDQDILDSQAIKTQVFSNLPVTSELSGVVNFDLEGNTFLEIKNTATSIPVTISPSSIINQSESADLLAPISTSTLTGLMGEIGFYRSDVTVNLSSNDALGGDSSGLLNIRYSLNGGLYEIYSSTTPVIVTAEGQHTIKFYATDRAGNNELEKEVSFVIDKTAPELIIEFNPTLKDLTFTATDTLVTLLSKSVTSTPKNIKLKLVDKDTAITASDQAGNMTVLTLKDKDRKNIFKAEVKSITYNGLAADISKTSFGVMWLLDKQGRLVFLSQNVKSKKDFNVLSLFSLGKTVLTGKDQNGKIRQTFNGYKTIKIYTNKGDFGWK